MQKRSCEERAGMSARRIMKAAALMVLLAAMLPVRGVAQVSTTTVQGTVYRADGTPASGTLLISWPAFTTAQDQAVAAGNLNASIGANGFVSVNLTPNAGGLPSGTYYTATYHLNDGSVDKEYWVVPASGTATIGAVRAELQPSTVAVQSTVTPSYVQSAIASLSGTYLPLSGGTLSGSLTLEGDPVASSQAATKHYADQLAAQNLPLSGGTLNGPLTAPSFFTKQLEGRLYADQWQSPSGSGNNGIANALVQAASQSYVAQVLAPALYAQVEQQPWGGTLQWAGQHGAKQGPPASVNPGSCVTDYRFGGPEVICTPTPAPNWSQIPSGFNRFQMGPSITMHINQSVGTAFSNYTAPALALNKYTWTGTYNFSAGITNSPGQTDIANLQLAQTSFSSGSNNAILNYLTTNAPGDSIGILDVDISRGGISAEDNEGNEDKFIHEEATDVWGGIVNSITAQSSGTSPCTGPCYVLSAAQTQGNTGGIGLGDQNPLIDVTQADMAGYISSISGSGAVTVRGSDFDAKYGDSNAWGTTTQAITNPTNTTNTFPQTNVTVSISTTSGTWNTSLPVCIFDASGVNWECEKVTAASPTSITFAVVEVPYFSGSVIAQGGMAGMGFSAQADWVGPGIPNPYSTVDNAVPSQVVRPTVPIEYNQAGGILQTIQGTRVSFNYTTTRAYQSMAGSGGTCSATLSGGTIASCSCSAGTGYLDTNHPPQLTVTGLTGTTQPTLYVSGISSGALSACSVANAGSGLSGTPLVTVTTSNPFAVYPMARTINVWNPSTGAVDGSSLATDQLTPSASVWHTGDTVEQQHGYAAAYVGDLVHAVQFQGAHTEQNGRIVTFGGPIHENDYGDWLQNDNDPRLYQGYPSSIAEPWQQGYGQLTTPYGYTLSGAWRSGLRLFMPTYGANGGSLSGALVISCFDSKTNTHVCGQWNQWSQVVTHQNANSAGTAEDELEYNPVTTTWQMTAGATGTAGNNPTCTTTLAGSANGGFSVSCGGHTAKLDTSGNLTLPGPVEARGNIAGASINGEITVDGTTYTTLNAAWTAAAAQAGSTGQNQTVRLGPGTYPVTATLTEPTNGACVNLLGSGGTTMNADSAQIATTLTVPSALNGDVISLGNTTQAQGCTFKDIDLLAGGNAAHGFELQWFRGLLIDNVTVNDTTAEGILLGEEDTSAGHQASFLVRNVTVSYSSAAFTPANRPAYGIHLQKTAIDSHLDDVVVRNALTAAVYNEGTGNTGYLIHGFGYPYTCTAAPCANNASSGSAANASYATNYVIYDVGGGGSVWTDTYVDSPATAGFYIGANGVAIHGGHIQWPDVTSFPSANLAYVAANVSNNLLIADVDCLEMAAGVNWITYAGTSGNPPSYASVHHLTGCGNYYQALEPANTSGFSSGGANINDPSGAVPRVWSTPVAAAASYPAFSAQMYTGYQGDAFQAHFSGVNPFFNVTYQGTIRTNGGIALSTVTNTASTLTLTPANKNVIADASSGPQTITLPSCYTPLPDRMAPTGLEFTIIKSDTTANTVTLATTSSQTIYSQGVGASTLVLSGPSTETLVCGPDSNWYVAGSTASGSGSASAPHMTWYGSFAGTFGTSTNNSLGAIWSPTDGVNMTRLDIAVGTAPSGCTTWPAIGIYDSTAGAWLKTVTLASGTYSYRNAVSAVAVPAGHNLSMGVQTAGAGCTTNAGSAQLTMEYTMQ